MAGKLPNAAGNLTPTGAILISFPAHPPSVMSDDPRVAALARLRQGGLLPGSGPDWDKLLRCVEELPACLPVESLPQWRWQALPQRRALRPPARFWADVMGALARACDAPKPGAASASACVVRAPVASVLSPASAAPARSPRKHTKNQAAFLAAVESVTPAEAVRALQEARTATSTKGTYRAALPLYEAACARGASPPWPPSKESLAVFAGYLKVSEAFASPATYWWAVVEEARHQPAGFHLDRHWAKGIVAALERGLPPQEQAEPLTIPVLRSLAAAVSTEVDFTTVLGLVCALFTLARVDSFLTLCPEDVQDVGRGKVRVCLSRLKGERRREVVDPVFERLGTCAGEFRPLWTPLGVVPLCPVLAFRLLRRRARDVGAPTVAQCDTDQALIRRLSHLCARAGVQQKDPGRVRNRFTAHSTRVAGVCYLLRAGVPEWVVSILANWSSDQVKRYARRLALDPGLVMPWAFFNPSANEMQEAAVSSPPPKRRKR